MTEAAQKAKSARGAKYGELQICGRCKGTGFTNYHPQFGMCFKCYGEGVHIKIDPKQPSICVNYIVKDSANTLYKVNTLDKGCNGLVSNNLWINDKFSFIPFKKTEAIEVIVLAKYIKTTYPNGRTEEKYSKDFNKLQSSALLNDKI